MNNNVLDLSKQAKKKKFQLRRKHSNSKYGCLQCKKRRIKCSQELPQCKHCMSYRAKNLRCSYMDLTEAEKDVIREANRKIDEGASMEVTTPTNTARSPIFGDNGVLNAEQTDDSNGLSLQIPGSGSSTSSRLSASPSSSIREDSRKLPRGIYTNAKFKVYKIKMLSDDETLLNEIFGFISKNLKLPIINNLYVKYIEFIWNLWGNTTIVDAGNLTLSNYYSLITWSSAYLSTCIHDSVKGNLRSHLGKQSKRITKPLQNLALISNMNLLQNLQSALSKSDYRLLLNLMSSNTFISSSDYKEDGYKSRMFHLNGLIAIIYELYLHGNKSTIYVSGIDGYQSEDLSFIDSVKKSSESHQYNHDVPNISNDGTPQVHLNRENHEILDVNHSIEMTRQDSSKNFFVPGYSYFNNFTVKESILIKFFEWQVYLAAIAIFVPPYDHHCLYELYHNFLDFRKLLVKVDNNLLIHYADNLICYLQYLFREIFPLLEKRQPSDKLFDLSPKVYYTIYMKYLLATPPELFMSIFKNSRLSVIERILYRYYHNVAKILDQVFPQIKYLFILGFVSAYMLYADEVNVFGDILGEGSESYHLTPPENESGEVLTEDFLNATKYHALYCLRVFTYFRSRNILLHNGMFVTNPFPDIIKQNRLASRKVSLQEEQIHAFNNVFIRPHHFPHIVKDDPDHFSGSNGTNGASHQEGEKAKDCLPTFKGFSLEELRNLNPNYSNYGLGHYANIPIGQLKPETLMRDTSCPKDSDGNILGYDYVVGLFHIPIVLRHLVGKSLTDLYDDRAFIFSHFEEHEP